MSVAIWFTNLANCCFRSVTINKVLTDSWTGSTRSEKLLITHLELSLIIIRSYHHRFLYIHLLYDVSPTGFVNGEALRLLRPDSSIKTFEKHCHNKIFCLPGTIPARTMFKRGKYADLRIGVKSLYSGHKVSSIEVTFDFPAAYSTHLEKKLTKILQDKKVASKTIKKSQKWLISQNCEIVKSLAFFI